MHENGEHDETKGRGRVKRKGNFHFEVYEKFETMRNLVLSKEKGFNK